MYDSNMCAQSWFTFTFIWSVAVGLGMQILSDVRANLQGNYNRVVPYAPLRKMRFVAHVAGRLFYIYSLFLWPFLHFSLLKAIVFATVPIAGFSWSFMLNSQINHLTEHTAHASDPHFLKHQIVTAQDFGPQDPFCVWFSGGLNMQIEHHCFPCVNHCHLRNLQPKLAALCVKHNVKYNMVAGYKEAFASHVKHTEAMGVRPFSVGHEH